MDYSIMYPHCHSGTNSASTSRSSSPADRGQGRIPLSHKPMKQRSLGLDDHLQYANLSTVQEARQQGMGMEFVESKTQTSTPTPNPISIPLPSSSNSSTPKPHNTHFKSLPTNQSSSLPFPSRKSPYYPLSNLETRLSALLWACDEGTHSGCLDRSTSTGECYWSGNAGLSESVGNSPVDEMSGVGSGVMGSGMGIVRKKGSMAFQQQQHLSTSPYASHTSSPSTSPTVTLTPNTTKPTAPPPPHHTHSSPASFPTKSNAIPQTPITPSSTPPTSTTTSDDPARMGLGVSEMALVGMKSRGMSFGSGSGLGGERGRFDPSMDPRLLGI